MCSFCTLSGAKLGKCGVPNPGVAGHGIVGAVRTLKMQDAATLLNVSPSALRSWERRFGYPAPMRTAGGHRHYAHGEIIALREALEEGLSISSAVGRAREALLAATPDALTRALATHEFEHADNAMEAALALRSLERTVDDVLFTALAEIATRTPPGSAPWALTATWACDWLRRAWRLCPAPWGITSVLMGDATKPLELDGVRVRALELLSRRAGAHVTTLPVDALAGLGQVLRAAAPQVVVIAGSSAAADSVARWTYAVQHALGGRPLLRYLRPGPGTATTARSSRELPGTPALAQRRLIEVATRHLRHANSGVRTAS
jgi:DNA-binding transcriptional MerR regulator